jgi:Ser/Thr protein kinase RdoA (MazF antagonist)
MTLPAQPAPAVRSLLREYDLGPLIDAQPLAGGSAAVLRISAGRGSFVLKPAGRLADVGLQARAANHLNNRGIRQARIVPTRAGDLVSSDRNYLQEFLPGAIAPRPDGRQTAASMRHIGAYHRALADLPGEYEPDTGSLWQRVADPGYLLRELPGLLARYQLTDDVTGTALAWLDQLRPELAALPSQVVHGDIGPDNVLMDANGVVAVIDFTPFCQSALFGGCTALYWYHVYGQLRASPDQAGAGPAAATEYAELSVGQLRASVAALGNDRPWTRAELALWPAGLLREALRRLATPLALAAESGRPPGPSLAARHAALHAVLKVLPGLSQ